MRLFTLQCNIERSDALKKRPPLDLAVGAVSSRCLHLLHAFSLELPEAYRKRRCFNRRGLNGASPKRAVFKTAKKPSFRCLKDEEVLEPLKEKFCFLFSHLAPRNDKKLFADNSAEVPLKTRQTCRICAWELSKRIAGVRGIALSGVGSLAVVGFAKMERTHSHRTPEEVELALEVLNDELAEASPLDRPSLELATQALTERLVVMRKQNASRNPSTSLECSTGSTHEYSQSLQPVIVGEGTQKYTLIRIPKQDDMLGDVYLVRGDPTAEYHYQTALDTLKALQSRNIMSGAWCVTSGLGHVYEDCSGLLLQCSFFQK